MIAEGRKILSARIACRPASSMAGTKMFLKYRSNGGPNGMMTKQVLLGILGTRLDDDQTCEPFCNITRASASEAAHPAARRARGILRVMRDTAGTPSSVFQITTR